LGILPECRHWLVHDHWKPYDKYDALHALCNQHLLRELKFLSEEHQQEWASDLADFLVNQKNAPQTAAGLDEEQFNVVLAQYQRIVSQGRKLHPRPPPDQGRSRQTKEANLLDRLEDDDLSVLAFLVDPRVPFTNNQGERDIRRVKSKEKISGGFRTFKGAQVFARIRGYFSTARKQGKKFMGGG
jgi:transposase